MYSLIWKMLAISYVTKSISSQQPDLRSINEYFVFSRGAPKLVIFSEFSQIGTEKPFLKSPGLIHHNLSCTFSETSLLA